MQQIVKNVFSVMFCWQLFYDKKYHKLGGCNFYSLYQWYHAMHVLTYEVFSCDAIFGHNIL